MEFGLDMRREGRRNYIDWAVQCEHRDGDRIVTIATSEPMRARVYKSGNEWKLSLAGRGWGIVDPPKFA